MNNGTTKNPKKSDLNLKSNDKTEKVVEAEDIRIDICGRVVNIGQVGDLVDVVVGPEPKSGEDGAEDAHHQKNDHAPENVEVRQPLQATPLVPRTAVIQHCLRVLAFKSPQTSIYFARPFQPICTI